VSKINLLVKREDLDIRVFPDICFRVNPDDKNIFSL